MLRGTRGIQSYYAIVLVIAVGYGNGRAVDSLLSGFRVGPVAVRVHRLPTPKVLAYHKRISLVYAFQSKP